MALKIKWGNSVMMDMAVVHACNAKQRRARRRADFGYGFSLVQSPVWTLAQVLLATGGRVCNERTQAAFRMVSTDSRKVEAGDLFVALKGERFDGHDFIAEVVRRGAAGLVVDSLPAMPVPVPLVLVPDTLQALGDLAHYRRMRMRGLTVLAVTGSSGKTTVKEMLASILEQDARVLKTKGNLNNLIGLPLSLLPVDSRDQYAVMEMGMNMPGEIARMARIAVPDVACITNIQEAHLAGLADINGVAKAKGELFAGAPGWATLAVNLDDKRVRKLARKSGREQIGFGFSSKARVRGLRVSSLGERGMSFTLKIDQWQQRVKIAALGTHNVQNCLAAAAMALAVGISHENIASGLAAYKPFSKRLHLQPFIAGLKVVDETYNANPSSMLAALDTVHNLRRERRVIAVLGDMLELGGHGPAAHRFIGSKVAEFGFDYLLTVGEYAGETAAAAHGCGMEASHALACKDKDEVLERLLAAVREGRLAADDIVLLKGSRGMRMETIIDKARELWGEG